MKTAVVLFNLGGPDSPEAVKPFLFNLFRDRAIIRLIAPLRLLLAWLISSRRAPFAQEIYHYMGGYSPILPETQAQAKALEAALGSEYKVFTCMRYWHPRSSEAARAVKAYAPDQIVLLPLYPQFSTTTTVSSLADWHKAARRAGLKVPTASVFDYPEMDGLVSAHADAIRTAYAAASAYGIPRILFSAHGLPESIVRGGDPYPSHIKRSVEAIVRKLAIPELHYIICYQSRVGRLPWIGPATDTEIIRAAKQKLPLVVVPIAFVSEHSETLVELDIEYKKLADQNGASAYIRTPTPSVNPAFIDGLARLVRHYAHS